MTTPRTVVGFSKEIATLKHELAQAREGLKDMQFQRDEQRANAVFAEADLDAARKDAADAIVMLCEQFGLSEEELPDWLEELRHKDNGGRFDQIANAIDAAREGK